MAQENTKYYPVGTQTFSKIREGGYVYVDKTEYVYRMTHADMCYVFLSRPRRFGKSLLVSTLKSYFEGDKELFKGLAIERLEKEWKKYPVLHFDMSTAKHADRDKLISELSLKLSQYEQIYGRDEKELEINQRLHGLIKRAYLQEGKKVVVLIDEYDAPLLDVAHEEENLPKLRNVMRGFYSPLKACDPYLRFVFMTGITKFSQMSIFSELNNIKNISMLESYSAVCGITGEEILNQMSEGVDKIAGKMKITREDSLQRIKTMYDGYHFTWPSPDIYNPFSLVNAFADGKLLSYWFGSGTPTYLVEMLKKFKVEPFRIGGRMAKASAFDAPTENMTDITPLLYQSGYITITDYNEFTGLYTLDIPNTEVRVGLMENLLPNYVKEPSEVGTIVGLMTGHIHFGRMHEALQLLQKFLRTIPYTNNAQTEGHYQSLLYVIFTLLGAKVSIEEHTVDGRIDAVLRKNGKIYIMELKVGKSADAALRQIEKKDYATKFALEGLPVVKVGISFDNETRTLSDWKIVDD